MMDMENWWKFFQRRWYQELSHPCLFVVSEKYAERYFHCATQASLLLFALKIVKERLTNKMYEPPEPIGDNEIADWADLMDAIPAGAVKEKLKAFIEAEHISRLHKQHEYKQDLAIFTLAEDAMRTNDGRMALRVLEARGQYEYEKWSLECYEGL